MTESGDHHMSRPNPAPGPVSRLLLVVTGSLSAAFVPHWANWLRLERPQTSTRVVVTPSALNFVTPTALAAATGGQVVVDRWQSGAESSAAALHATLAGWADAILVWPSSWHYTARIAQGLGDSPSLLAIHIAGVEVLVAPSVPPGSLDSPVFAEHLERIRSRPRHQVAPMLVATSASTGRPGALVPPPLPDLVQALEHQCAGSTPRQDDATSGTSSARPSSAS